MKKVFFPLKRFFKNKNWRFKNFCRRENISRKILDFPERCRKEFENKQRCEIPPVLLLGAETFHYLLYCSDIVFKIKIMIEIELLNFFSFI